MEEPDPDSGADPPQAVPRRVIKTEPMDEGEHNSNAVPNDAIVNNETGGEAGRQVQLVNIKLEIKEEMEDPPAEEKKQEEEEADYCFCGASTLVTDFMIACEKCDTWFHGPCVEIDSDMSGHIKKFFCKTCTQLHRISTTYKKSFAIFMDRRERKQNAAEAKRKKKEAADAKKLAKTMKKTKVKVKEEIKEEVEEEVKQEVKVEVRQEVKIEVKEEVKEEHEERAPRCEKCINCTAVASCNECYYCTSNVGRCIKVNCLSVITDNKPKDPEPAPTVSPKGSGRRKTQRKRKSGGDSDDDELFFSESTATRQIKTELSYKEEQQLEREMVLDADGNLVEKKKRGRRKGWRKDKDGKKKEGEEGVKKEKKTRRKRKVKEEPKVGGRIQRVGRGAEFNRQNGPENMEFERPEYDTTLNERLEVITSTHADLMEKQGLITEVKKNAVCKNDDCEAQRRNMDDYCSEDCGMKMAQKRLGNAGLIAKPLAVVPKKKRRFDDKEHKADRLAKEEARRVEWLSDLQEKEYQKRKAEREAAKEEVEPVNHPDELMPAVIKQLQKDVTIMLKEEEVVERAATEADTAEHEKQRKIAEEEYRKQTSYIPIAANAALTNGLATLMAQPVVRPVPLHPNPGMFPPAGYFNTLFNPFLNPLHVNGLSPSIPMPVMTTPGKAMLDHNDYFNEPIIPLATLLSMYPQIFQDPTILQNPNLFLNPQPAIIPQPNPQPLQNNPPSDHSSPSTLSSASPIVPAVPDAPVVFAVPEVPIQFAVPNGPAPAVRPPPMPIPDPKDVPTYRIPSNVPIDIGTAFYAAVLASLRIPVRDQNYQPPPKVPKQRRTPKPRRQ